MKKIDKVYISGLGAVGGAYGSIFFNYNPESIVVIADKKRIAKYQEKGIVINNNIYSFNYLSPEEKNHKADLILIAVKYHQLEQSLEDIKNFVKEDTIILSLLNGITSEEIISKKYGEDKVLHSFVVAIDAVREDTKINFSSIGKIVFGTNTDNHKHMVNAVKNFFDKAGVPYNIPTDIIRELWWKFMMNVGLNQVSAILGADYGVYQSIKEARDLMEAASMEVVYIAEKAGIDLHRDDISKCFEILNTLSPTGEPSMLQDIKAGRKTEVEMFSKTVIELGEKYNINTPVNKILFKMIKTLEQMNN
ncbi:MAG: ketopantoate reductase family protein [Leptospirales bacterium]|nr:ketopantoate reductase family protein [Leptospirales bacterium]